MSWSLLDSLQYANIAVEPGTGPSSPTCSTRILFATRALSWLMLDLQPWEPGLPGPFSPRSLVNRGWADPVYTGAVDCSSPGAGLYISPLLNSMRFMSPFLHLVEVLDSSMILWDMLLPRFVSSVNLRLCSAPSSSSLMKMLNRIELWATRIPECTARQLLVANQTSCF